MRRSFLLRKRFWQVFAIDFRWRSLDCSYGRQYGSLPYVWIGSTSLNVQNDDFAGSHYRNKILRFWPFGPE
jgi:hypothetical protein